VLADVTANMAKGTPYKALISVDCEHGTVEIENPVLPHRGHSIRERFDGVFMQHTVAGATSFDYQLDALIRVLGGSGQPLTGGADAIGNMAAIDAIYIRAGFAR
jgi:hypothetical protein